MFNPEVTIPDVEMELKHHYMGRETIKVKLNECLNWLTEHADPVQMCNNPLVLNLEDELHITSASSDIIDLLDGRLGAHMILLVQRIWSGMQ